MERRGPHALVVQPLDSASFGRFVISDHPYPRRGLKASYLMIGYHTKYPGCASWWVGWTLRAARGFFLALARGLQGRERPPPPRCHDPGLDRREKSRELQFIAQEGGFTMLILICSSLVRRRREFIEVRFWEGKFVCSLRP